MNSQSKFHNGIFTFTLAARYVHHKGKSTGAVMREWDACGITWKVFDGY